MKKFTLIELLVVVAIIGILASLILPSLGKARKTSRNTLCINNMKQNGILIELYADDNNQRYPFNSAAPMPVWLGKNGSSANYTAGTAYDIAARPLNKYIGYSLTVNAEIKTAMCPFNTGTAGYWNYSAHGVSYQGHSRWDGAGDATRGVIGTDDKPVTLYSIINPVEFFTMSEVAILEELWTSSNNKAVTYHTSENSYNGNESPVLFADGHVKKVYLPYDEVTTELPGTITSLR